MRILGTGSAQPERRVTNEELTAFLDTSDEWKMCIRDSVYAHHRHIAQD